MAILIISMVELMLNNYFAYDWNRSLDLEDINSSKRLFNRCVF